MPLPCDYHNHPQAHVLQPYTVKLLQPWIDRARRTGIRSLAFTDHDRYLEGVDFDVVDRLRDANPDLEILIGIELDNDPVTSERGVRWVEAQWAKLDLVLGFVFYLPAATEMFDRADQTAQLTDRYGLEKAFTFYIAELEKILARGLIDCFAHLDLIKIHGVYPAGYEPAAWFGPIVDRIGAAGLAIEASTAGWRKKVEEQYPHVALLELARDRNLPVTTASDAHAPAQLAAGFDRLEQVLGQVNVTNLVRFSHHAKMPQARNVTN
ncbi:MAG: histidinol-phosphatase [Verrucomicrobia bacterium]|nr:histidinol-phosphatase [Verrucomicrobiota bacterium]